MDELMAHRIIWTLVAVLVFQIARGRFGALRETFAVPANRRAHFRGGIFVTLNWGIFIWALLHEQVIEASLGYFLVPFVSAALGRILFQERLQRLSVWPPSAWRCFSYRSIIHRGFRSGLRRVGAATASVGNVLMRAPSTASLSK